MIRIRKIATPLLLAIVGLSSAYADQPVRKQPANCNMAGCNMVPKGCPVLCSSYLDINCNNLLFDVGILLEQVKLTGTQFAFTSYGGPSTTVTGFTALPREATLLKPHFKLQWGVTVGLGYYFSHDDWLLKGRFDWLRSKASRNVEAEWNEYLVPTYIWETGMQSTTTNVTYFAQANAHLTVDYFNLDIDLNRGSFISNCISLEPHVGIKSTWIEYKSRVSYDPSVTSTIPIDVQRSSKTEFWGMGPAFGLNSVWSLIDDVGLFFDNNIALLFGKSTVKDYVYNLSDPGVLSTHATSAPPVLSPAVRTIFGVQWERCCFSNTQHLTFRAGADASAYWNQYQHINVSNEYNATTGSLSDPKFLEQNNDLFGMIGLLVELKWDF